jgi:hypothetical protein
VRIAALIAVLLCLARPGWADDRTKAQAAVDEANEHWRALDYELVVEAAERALAAADVTDADRVDAWVLQGKALVVLEKTPDAEAAFERVFDVDADFELPDGTSPAITLAFRRARAAWQVKQEDRLRTELGEPYAAMRMTVTIPPEARGGHPIAVRVELVDPGSIASQIVVHYRRQGARNYDTLTARAGAAELSIPGAFTASDQDYVLEVYARSLSAAGVTLRRDGDPDRPRLIRVTAGDVPKQTPIYRKWWFWTGVAAAALTTAVLVDQARDVGTQGLEFR